MEETVRQGKQKGQVQQQEQVKYQIGFPRSLQNNNDQLTKAKELIARELQLVAQNNQEIVIDIPRNAKYPITCSVNKNDEYFFLSQLQLLKMKYIEYGIYWF